ncbi:glycogen debranching enzyme-like protein [Motilibacter peucedani]|uniref:Glycogen debranching enzyme-like protein n=1 Tax=Motilibacter peucedani TaxID=598650 RepID=A0A420XMY8_9ACTN|nr:glycogen debranching N-terminal domain-containing protein [Motilibacter peucedani]RKS72643.1 glycogen debranching enzyme-like protein [Motilibacter peucedani]
MDVARQPLLHDLVATLRAPSAALSAPSGQVLPGGVQGVFAGDVRVVSRAEVRVGGEPPEPVAGGPLGADHALFVGLTRALGDPGPDPTVRLERERHAVVDGSDEELRLVSTAAAPVATSLSVAVEVDLAAMEVVKSGGTAAPLAPSTGASGLEWSDGTTVVRVSAPGADVRVEGTTAYLTWELSVGPRASTAVRWQVRALTADAPVVSAPAAPTWSTPEVTADDRRLRAFVARALDDLDALRMAPADSPDDVFLAAGAPWFFTLFGRDGIWAARMLLPLGTRLAGGTLRALAARQGTTVDPRTAEAPGKIPHELRRVATVHDAERMQLPPLYFGTVDATPLWVCLLHDAWRWGLPEDEVRALLPAMERALEWMPAHGDPDGDGFLEYVDETGSGLANQGWKDSGDSIRFADGTRAAGPVALCEAQAYACEAALSGAALLDAFGRPGAERWRSYAADMAARFRERFWTSDGQGRFPALALDGDGRLVDSVTSNLGHLLGTGLLDEEETALVADRLVGTDMSSGSGLRTMSTRMGGYSPLSYHCGSVWPHDTAIAVAGLARAGLSTTAEPLMAGLLAAAVDFDDRMPELFAGLPRDEVPRTVPYPAACRPQAWSAAAAVVLLTSALGLEAHVPEGYVSVRPARPAPFGALHVSGLRAGGAELRVEVDREGSVVVAQADGLEVRTTC